jgi:SAM-dependent methyltransferase
MDPVRRTLDRVLETEGTERSRFGVLAPVHDFVLARRYDHDATAEFVAERAPLDTEAVVAGGCGSGRLLAALDERYTRAVGVDARQALLSLAAKRTDAPLVAADVRRPYAREAFRLSTLLGNTLAHFGREGGLEATLESVHDGLRPGGVFVCDFADATTFADCHVTEAAFESGRYRVERTVVTARTSLTPDGVAGELTYAFTVLDRDRGDIVRVGTTQPVVAFRPEAVREAALDAGFDDATLVDPPTPQDVGLVARRAE